ncbi:Homogentisate solanesyltransferase, chloroplastic [Linum perenne]
MELSCSPSSRISATTSSYRLQSKLPINPIPKPRNLPRFLLPCSKLSLPAKLSSSRRNCSNPPGNRGFRRNSVWACSQVGVPGSDPIITNKLSDFKDACWRFLRPHTIRGTVLGSTALVSRALIGNPELIKWSLVLKALSGLVALLCGNGYIVGINQIYDIGIDKVNKPYLPIAAGDLSVPTAWLLVILFARFAVAAFLIIATVRGFLLNFGVYYATRAALGLPFEWSYPVAFITSFVTLFALVIAITKDLPDVEGDRKFNISTFATKLGVRNIAFLGSGLLLVNYISAVLAAIYFPQAFRLSLMIPVHTILAACLVFQVQLITSSLFVQEAISEFYRFIWNLFYAEYMIFPFI